MFFTLPTLTLADLLPTPNHYFLALIIQRIHIVESLKTEPEKGYH